MAYDTHYLGHIQVRPALNEAEFSYLTAFAEKLHEVGTGALYDVPDNPLAPRENAQEGWRVIERREDVPDAVCSWTPSCHGECLVIRDDDGQHRQAARWLQFLYDHFLRQGGLAEESGMEEFGEFTFNHTLDAVVAAHRSDSGELWLIRPEGDLIVEETVWHGDPDWWR